MRFKSVKAEERVYLPDYETHFENGPIPMWIIDPDTLRFLLVNNAAVEKYGYNKQEFGRMTILEIRPADEVASTLQKVADRNADFYDAGYVRHRKKNGAVFYVHVFSHTTLFMGKAARLCFVLDVNDRFMA